MIRLGRHRFAVNTQPFDLTLVPSGNRLAFALTGTDYRAPVTDPAFAATRPYWDQLLPSESPDVYRGEHLAARLLTEHGADALGNVPDLAALVRETAAASYDEGYQRGVHDADATAVLAALLRLHAGAGLLRFPPGCGRRRSCSGVRGRRRAAYVVGAPGGVAGPRPCHVRARPAIAGIQEEWALAIGPGDADPPPSPRTSSRS
ncbi:hypothetical protein NKH18_25190 [Streptomyces sp. M10(2022)]